MSTVPLPSGGSGSARRPLLAVDTEELRLTGDRGAAVGAFTVTNRGGALLEGTVTPRIGGEWLRIAPTALCLAPAESRRVQVRADPSGLAPGYTRGEIEVVSNGGAATVAVRVGVAVGHSRRRLAGALAACAGIAAVVGVLLANVAPAGAPSPAATARHQAQLAQSTRPGVSDLRTAPAVETAPELRLDQVATRVLPTIMHVQANIHGRFTVGTGFTIRSTATSSYVVTNYHVVASATTVVLQRWVGHSYVPAGGWLVTRRWEDPAADLAVLRIDHGGLPVAHWGDSETLRPGQAVVAIGYAHNLSGGPTLTHGIVSSLERTIPGDPGARPFIGHSAAINRGSSGGPLVDMSARVVGINTWTLNNTQGLFFAIPSSRAVHVAAGLMSGHG